MERANVSSAYERKRSRKRTADDKEATRKAGRARRYTWKPYWNALCLTLPKSTIMTRSMSKMKQGETENEKIVLYVVVENPEIMDDTVENVVVGRAEEKVAAEPPVISANATMERWSGEPEWWEEWPLYWTYEEQWMWWSPEEVWPDVGGRPYWEVPTSGTFGCVAGDDGEEPWGDDIWNFRGKH